MLIMKKLPSYSLSSKKEKKPNLSSKYVEMVRLYKIHHSCTEVAKIMGENKASVHRIMKSYGYLCNGNGEKWSIEELSELKKLYKDGFNRGDGKLDEFCRKHKRTKTCVCGKAKKLGLSTNYHRRLDEKLSESLRNNIIEWHKNNEHPKGMLGKHHTDKTKERLRETTCNHRNSLTEDQKWDITMKSIKTKIEKYGTSGNKFRKGLTWKSEWREIGGIKKYYRSRWEANYARYLEWLLIKGEIKKWEHEPETFWFNGIKRGCVSYLPDFRVTENNGNISYHEVKGWMDDKSITKLKRMKKYYPNVKLILIDKKVYLSIEKTMSSVINGWEK